MASDPSLSTAYRLFGTTAPQQLPRVLLAEDDLDFQRLLALYLRRAGYRVSCVSTAVALLGDLELSYARGDPPALAISDHRMPGMTGLHVLQQVREWGWTLPLVLITAFGDDEIERQAARIRVTLMRKPFDLDDFGTLVGFLAPRSTLTRACTCAACGRSDDLSWWDAPREVFICRDCWALLRAINDDADDADDDG